MSEKINRRTFTKTSAVAAATLSALSASRVVGANARIRLGFIGVANRGGQLLSAFQEHQDAEIVALCDVARSTLDKANARFDGKAATFGDFRKMLERKDLDAVVIATPDHWHALQTVAACNAGKDVYVEKPVSITIHEGRKMVEVARRTKRVVQVGIHRRSSQLYRQTAEFVRGDGLGKVTVSRCYHLSNMYPNGIGKAVPSQPPADLDWDMWLGPRPARPFQETIAPYKFRWWSPYSSQIGNNGVHFIDCVRWMTGDEAPNRICALGGRFAVDDDRTIPDTMEATFELPSGRLLIFGQYEANGNPALAQPGWCELRGTQASAYISEATVQIVPERGGQFQDHKPRLEPQMLKATNLATVRGNANLSLTAQHARNFLDCIRSRDLPHCDIEIGHRSTTFAHLANMAMATRKCLEWDPKQERVVNCDEANSLLHYEYRKPWKLD
jgi:predicted dehydrogenase